MFESGQKKPEKRKKVKGGDAGEIDNFLGPWAKYADEKDLAKPSEVFFFPFNMKLRHVCVVHLTPGKTSQTKITSMYSAHAWLCNCIQQRKWSLMW